MIRAVLAATAGIGVALVVLGVRPPGDGVVAGGPPPVGGAPSRRQRWGGRATAALEAAGLDGVSPLQFAATVLGVGLAGALAAATVLGPGAPALAIGAVAACLPVAGWRARRRAARRAARDHWPRLVEELRVLTTSAGRPVPQALIEVGLHGPVELRPAFLAAQREWSLTTDFAAVVEVLRDRLGDATADATLATLLIADEVGGDVDPHLRALAEDRRADLRDRREAAARQAGARLARIFVVLVPAGMGLAGMNVGDGAAAFRTGWGQVAVVAAVALVAACWWWAGRIMRLPDDERVLA